MWVAEVEDMQLISKYNKGFQFLYLLFSFFDFSILICVIDTFSKYVWVSRLKQKKCITITNAFQMSLGSNETKYGQKKVVNFTIGQRNHDYKKIIQKCVQHVMTKNLLLLKDL